MRLFLSIFFTTLIVFGSQAQEIDSLRETPLRDKIGIPVGVENKINYKNEILGNKLDYKLLHSQKGKFILKLNNTPTENLDIKIYDVIGNLIKTDKFIQGMVSQKEYDFSKRRTKIYVVKVSNDAGKLVKKINI